MHRRYLVSALLLAAITAAGFFSSKAGLGRTEAAPRVNYALGNLNSPIEVFIFTDWYCPACEKVESVLLFTYPQMAQRARVHFIDKPIHKESTNFIPYNLSFAVYEKAKYPALRRALSKLATTTKNPTPDEVQKAIAHLGVTFRPLPFLDVTEGMADFNAKVSEFKVRSTPTVVVRSTKSGKTKLLSGTTELTAPKILAALDEVGR